MAKAHTTWKVLPHRPIEELSENLWRVEGKLEGMSLKRVMTVVRRKNGELVIHNAIALDEASMAKLDAWGRVAFLIVPNGFHRLDARIFKDRYPQARVFCPRGARTKVEQVVPVDDTYEHFSADENVRLETLQGVKEQEGVMLVHSSDGTTVVFNDAVFNLPHTPGFSGWIFRHITQSSGGPRVSRLFKLAVVRDRNALRAHLLKLAETPNLKRMIVSHHNMVEGDAAAAIRQAAATL